MLKSNVLILISISYNNKRFDFIINIILLIIFNKFKFNRYRLIMRYKN